MSGGLRLAVIIAGVVLFSSWLVYKIRYRWYRIPSEAMLPTIPPGSNVLTGPLDGIQRGDVVVFPAPGNPDTMSLKRVVGLPGETIAMLDKRILIDGKPLDEPYAIHDDEVIPAVRHFAPLRIPRDHYFVMGDNRDHANDSRYHGFVARASIRRELVLIMSNEGIHRP